MCIAMRRVALLILMLSVAVPLAAQNRGRGRLPRVRTFTYFIEDGGRDTGFKATDRELATWAALDWERHAGGMLRFVPAPETTARIRIKWVSPRSGQYGETRPARAGNRFVSDVFIRPDTSILSPSVSEAAFRDPLVRDTIVYLTCLHELGHAIGLSHTSDDRDIMYSFEFGGDVLAYFTHYRDQVKARAAIPMTTGLSPHDIDRLRALFPSR
jgi:hypothetical protein